MEEIHRKPLYLMVKTYGFPVFRCSPRNQSINGSSIGGSQDGGSSAPKDWVSLEIPRVPGKNAWSHRANPTVNIEMCKNRLETEWFRERVYNWWMF